MKCQDVVSLEVESRDGHSTADTLVRAMPVVVVHPGLRRIGAVWRVLIDLCMDPFTQGRLDGALGLAIGLRSIGTCEPVLDAQLAAQRAQGSATKGRAAVSEQPFDAHAQARLIGHVILQEL